MFFYVVLPEILITLDQRFRLQHIHRNNRDDDSVGIDHRTILARLTHWRAAIDMGQANHVHARTLPVLIDHANSVDLDKIRSSDHW